MATDVEQLVLQMSADLRQFQKGMLDAAGQADKAAARVEQRFQRMNQQITRDFQNFQSTVRDAIAAIGLGVVVRDVGELADTWRKVANTLSLAGIEAKDLAAVQSQIAQIAVDTRTDLESTAQLFARMFRSSGDLHANMEKVLAATRLVNEALAGADQSERAAATVQLGQALGSGRLQGDELKSILENSRPLAEAIAKEFNTSIGNLRNLGKQGALESERVFNAILGAAPEIEAAFARTSSTIGEAFTNLKTRAAEFVGTNGETSKSVASFTALIQHVANDFEGLASAAILTASVIGGTFAGVAMAQAIKAILDFVNAMSIAELRMVRLKELSTFLGGPLGVGLAIAGGAMAYLATQTDLFASASERAQQAQDSLYRALTLIQGLVPATQANAEHTESGATATEHAAKATAEHADKLHDAADATGDLESLTKRATDRLNELGTASGTAADHLTVQERAARGLAAAELVRARATIAAAIADQQSLIAITQRDQALRHLQQNFSGTEPIGTPEQEARRREAIRKRQAAADAQDAATIRDARAGLPVLQDALTAINSGTLAPTGPATRAAGPRTPTSNTATGAGGGGPTLQELRESAQLALARLNHETLRAHILEDELDIEKRTDAFVKAGLSRTAARAEAERDVLRERAAQTAEQRRSLEISRLQDESDLARARGLVAVSDALQDELEIRRRIQAAIDQGADPDQAARDAREFVASMRAAADEQRKTQLATRDLTNEQELARARGDTRSEESLQRQLDVQQRITDLRALGFDPETATRQAEAEVEALRKADLQGKFRQWFGDGIEAAMSGNVGDFIEQTLRDRATRALRDSINAIADQLFAVFQRAIAGNGQGGGSAGGIIGALSSLFGGGGGRGGGGGGFVDLLPIPPSFGGSFASGGEVTPGKWYNVGERGPETFVPKVPGFILPNDFQMGGGSPSYVDSRQFNIVGASTAEMAQLRAELDADFKSRKAQFVSMFREFARRPRVLG